MIPMRKYEYVIIRNDKEIGINEYGFDYLINLEKVLDEIREYIEKEFYTIQGVIVVEPDDIKEILDKVK